jgi:membrane protein
MLARILRGIFTLFADSFRGWSRHDPDLLSAAVAYNTLFALAPLLLLLITIAGTQYRALAIERIIVQVDRWGGPAITGLVADLLAGMQRAPSSPVVTIITAAVLAWGASGMVLRLRAAINAMWELTPAKAPNVKVTLLATLSGRLLSMGIVLAIGFLLFALLLLNTFATTLYSIYPEKLPPGLRELAPKMTPWISILLYFCIFVLTFKLLPQGKIHWRDLWAGALVTTVLFWLGNLAIKLYISVIFAASIHGVIASAIMFLLWVYYSAMIVLFGARFTYVYAEHYGKPIAPGRNMLRT